MANPGAGLQVIFGTGPVGVCVARHLLGEGLPVRMVSRRGTLPAELDGTAGTIRPLAADAMDAGSALEASRGATHVYHCMNVLYQDWARVLPVIHANLRAAATAHGSVLAAAQNLYMYAGGTGVIDDDTPIDPPSRKGRLQLSLHRKLEEAGRDGLAWTAVRASDYYGPGAGQQSVFGEDRFLGPLYRGKRPAMIGDPDLPHSYTYVADYGRALATAALDPAAHGRAWIVPNDRALTTRQVAQLFMAAAGRGSGIARLPRGALVAAGLFNPLIRELLEMLYQKEEPFTVDGSLFTRRFGMKPTLLETGIKETVSWFESRELRRKAA
jgi:nucleoside-diphosphate-sugar epimerase